jgi:hypothetical protein
LPLYYVTDKEKPVAVNCPKHDILIATKSEKELVKLPNVQFTDNIAVKRIDYSHPNPVEIQTGSQKTITVTARDSAGNTAYCMFDVHVDGKRMRAVAIQALVFAKPINIRSCLHDPALKG